MNIFAAIACHFISYGASYDEALAKRKRREMRETLDSLEDEISELSDNALFKLMNFRQPVRFYGKTLLRGRLRVSKPGYRAKARGRKTAAALVNAIAAIEAEIAYIERTEGERIAGIARKAHRARLLVAVARGRAARRKSGRAASVTDDGQFQFSF